MLTEQIQKGRHKHQTKFFNSDAKAFNQLTRPGVDFFFLKGQKVNMLGFASPRVMTTELCYCSCKES